MITEKQLLGIGFKRHGDSEGDPFYKITFKPPFKFGVASITGNFTESGTFEVYDNGTEYFHIEDLKMVVDIFREGERQSTIPDIVWRSEQLKAYAEYLHARPDFQERSNKDLAIDYCDSL